MRLSLQDQFRKTEQYEQKVADRGMEFESRVFERELINLENDREEKEQEMTKKILEFNFKVKQEADMLDATVKNELHGLREEIERETSERMTNDA